MPRVLKIHPSIGVARLGRSPDEHFIGPEQVGQAVAPPGGYRDAARRLKRQGARFRLFVYDDDGAPPRELRPDEADVAWTVHLANTKAAGDLFHAAHTPGRGRRNAGVTDRGQLVIDPGAKSISGAGQTMNVTSSAPFMGQRLEVTLGTLLTDEAGRLVVLGGFGVAGSPTGATLEGGDFADHDGWFDDVSDGPVTATVTMKDGSPISSVSPAWVIVAPPKFAPGMQPVVTLYDALFQAAIDRKAIPDPAAAASFAPSFTNDVYPILKRAVATRWVYARGQSGPPADFHSFAALPDAARMRIVSKLTIPASVAGSAGKGPGNMPRMWSDQYPKGPNGTLTQHQFAVMKAWREGKAVNDWKGVPAASGDVTPDGLDRAALESCVGGPLFPGIEASWKLRDEVAFVEPFRIDASRLAPGDVSQQMALPWQSDFLDCAVENGDAGTDLVWWPAQRPIDVWSDPNGAPVSWARSFANARETMSVDELIGAWDKLGLVLADGDAFLEKDRVDGVG